MEERHRCWFWHCTIFRSNASLLLDGFVLLVWRRPYSTVYLTFFCKRGRESQSWGTFSKWNSHPWRQPSWNVARGALGGTLEHRHKALMARWRSDETRKHNLIEANVNHDGRIYVLSSEFQSQQQYSNVVVERLWEYWRDLFRCRCRKASAKHYLCLKACMYWLTTKRPIH
jgi:hypothetical protein